MILPKVSRKAALILGKAAGALILAAVGGTVTWLLDQGRRRILEETPPGGNGAGAGDRPAPGGGTGAGGGR